MPRISWQTVNEFGRAYLVGKGLEKDEAAYVAEIAAISELFAPTHGLRLYDHLDRSIGDRLDPQARPVVVRNAGPCVVIDGRGAMGQLAMKLAVETAMRNVEAHGLCMVAVRSVHWIAALGPYLLEPVRRGLLGQLWAQWSDSGSCAPFGGAEGRLSTNPVALAFPTDHGASVADFSTSSYSAARLHQMSREGRKAPEAVFLDTQGQASNDPRDAVEGGAMLPAGGLNFGYKGYALSLWAEALAALAGGSGGEDERLGRQSANLLLIDPRALGGASRFASQVRQLTHRLRQSPPLEGFEGVRLPGEHKVAELDRVRQEGLDVSEKTFHRLAQIAEQEGLELRAQD
jgi:LDH2 family malate/lactate/ureidoglycolate dehydrogenase